MAADTLSRLMQWYGCQVDGDWEHQQGIIIDTLDNPGWQIRIDLVGTQLESVPFAQVDDNFEHETNWMRCWRDDASFQAACGVPRLEDALVTFLDWADSQRG